MKAFNCHRQCKVILRCIPIIKVHRRSAVDLAHKIHGDNESGGAPVVVLHGLLGSKRNWDSMCKMIASLNRKVVATDIRNHGESPHDSSHSYPELASDVSKLIDALALKQPVVIGHSMGGRTAMTLALTEPEKVSKLIAVDISPVSTAGILNDFFPQLIDQMKAVDFSGQQKGSVTEARGFARQKLLSTGLFADGGGIQFILMNIGKRGDTIGWMCNLDALKQHFVDIATFPEALKSKQYNGPVLFIGGDQSNYIPLYFRGGPIVTKSGSDDGIMEKSRELLEIYRHTYSDLGIFYNNLCSYVRKSTFDEVEPMMKITDGHRNFSMLN